MKNKMLGSKIIMTSLLVSLYFCLSICVTYADPVCGIPFDVQQSNGETITLINKGDEFLNWIEDEYGNLVVYENGDYYYANWSAEGPISNGMLASEEKASLNGDNETENNIKNALIEQAKQERIAMNEYYDTIAQQMRNSAELQGFQLYDAQDVSEPQLNPNLQRKVIVIYVNWEDNTGVEDLNILSKDTIVKSFFTGEKSVNAYYKAAFDSSSDIIIPAMGKDNPQDSIFYITLPGAHPAVTDTNVYFTDSNAIVELAKEISFKELDANDDNNIDSSEAIFAVLYHGYHKGSGNISRYPGVNGGVYDTQQWPIIITENDEEIYVRNFLHASTHIDHDPFTIGTIAHEIGHTGFGFKDQYYGDYNTGYWSLMGHGMWSKVENEVSGGSPSYVDAYSLVNSGIVIPGILPYSEYNERTITSPSRIYKVTTKDITENQYFLLQQRYKTGIFDMTAFKDSSDETVGGLLIYHIDENKNYYYKIAAIEEAHGGVQHINVYNGDANDLWGTDKIDFAKWTDPSSNLYDISDFESETNSSLVQNTSSGVRISDIFWDSINKQTSFTVGFPKEINIVSSDKQYNVTFNYPIQRATINSKNIYVKDTTNKLIDITWTISDDNKSILIYPPEGGYLSQVYTLVVGGKIMSAGGNELGQDMVVKFLVE